MSYYKFEKKQTVYTTVVAHNMPAGKRGTVIGRRAGDTGPEYLVKIKGHSWPFSYCETELAITLPSVF